MKLWLISQEETQGYDTFDSAVVAAKTETEARETHPSEYVTAGKWKKNYPCWATDPKNVKAKLIGTASPKTKAGVIVASFNAG